MPELDACLATALRLADLAAPMARAAWMGELSVSYKADGSALTRTDLEIEAAWRDHLARAHPQHGILGEEYGAETRNSAWTWVLDPIDGTRQFGTGLLNFASLISLCRDGVPVLGVIDLPLAGVRYLGIEGRATLFNDQPVRSSGVEEIAAAKIGLANPDSFAGDEVQGFTRLRDAARLAAYDGGAPAYGALARGMLDICLNGDDLDAFDICALVPVVTGAGGAITTWGGQPLGLTSQGAIIASASDRLHRQVLALLA
jgi:histidinol phosphatase-like enzyme (inositol monophosphatase family)